MPEDEILSTGDFELDGDEMVETDSFDDPESY